MKMISAFHGVLEDLKAAMPGDERLLGIVVSASGFQSGAVEMANQFGMLLLEICRPDKQAWRRYIHRFWPGIRPSVGDLDAFLFLNQRVHVVRDPAEKSSPLRSDPRGDEWRETSPVAPLSGRITTTSSAGMIQTLGDMLLSGWLPRRYPGGRT